MKIEHMPSPSDACVSVVALETAEERALSDDDLVRICANLQGVTYNHEGEDYALTGDDFGPKAAGSVERPVNAIVQVTVRSGG